MSRARDINERDSSPSRRSVISEELGDGSFKIQIQRDDTSASNRRLKKHAQLAATRQLSRKPLNIALAGLLLCLLSALYLLFVHPRQSDRLPTGVISPVQTSTDFPSSAGSRAIALEEHRSRTQLAEPADEEILIDQLVAFYTSAETYHADFELTYSNVALGESLSSSGHVFFKRPWKFRWDFARPEMKYLIFDGVDMWAYEPEFNQVAEIDAASSLMGLPLAFLGTRSSFEDFESELLPCNIDGAHCLELTPLNTDAPYSSLQITVSSDDYSVRKVVLVYPNGDFSEYVFTDAVMSDELPDEGFDFSPTPEMRVITL